MIHQVKQIIDNQPTFETPLQDILSELKDGGALQTLSPIEYHTDQQRKWWKGILLPALAKDTGDTVSVWETRLKLAVMPDEFVPATVTIADKDYTFIPSITKLSMKKLNELIEGSVGYLKDKGFDWVDLPDSEEKHEV